MGAQQPVASRVRLKDISERLGLSHATVSRSLNNVDDAFISSATKDLVRKVAAEMGYRPNHAARALVKGRTDVFALWLWSDSPQNSYHARVSQAMHAELRTHGYPLLLDVVGELEIRRESFAGWAVDGVVAHEAGPALQARLGRSGSALPAVCTGAFNWAEGFDCVKIHLDKGASDAMAHLIGSGRRRIAHVSNVLTRGADARHDTYLDSMAEAGLKPEVIGGFEDRASARKRIREYCLEFGMPDALFCHNDDVAMGVYRGLLDLGARVPDDVALVGCDGIEDGEYLEVPLTTIVQPIEEMCRIAFQLLERRIQDPASQLQQIDLYPQLVVRQSSSTANNSLMSDCNFIQRG